MDEASLYGTSYTTLKIRALMMIFAQLRQGECVTYMIFFLWNEKSNFKQQFNSACKNPLCPGSSLSGSFGNPCAFPLYPSDKIAVLSSGTITQPTLKRLSYDLSAIVLATFIHTCGQEGRTISSQRDSITFDHRSVREFAHACDDVDRNDHRSN